MPLSLVAVPIGHPMDITLRALQELKESDLIIFEERKEGASLLRKLGISSKDFLLLNEHSGADDVQEIAKACETKKVSLITDCGTPGFCDPGADLVAICRKKNISVSSLPGPSSLMVLLSLSSQRLQEFVFRGFLSPENEVRQKQWAQLKQEKRAIVLMDTPYRFQKMLGELKEHLTDRKVLIVTDMTLESELQWEGLALKISTDKFAKKSEFMVLVYPK